MPKEVANSEKVFAGFYVHADDSPLGTQRQSIRQINSTTAHISTSMTAMHKVARAMKRETDQCAPRKICRMFYDPSKIDDFSIWHSLESSKTWKCDFIERAFPAPLLLMVDRFTCVTYLNPLGRETSLLCAFDRARRSWLVRIITGKQTRISTHGPTVHTALVAHSSR